MDFVHHEGLWKRTVAEGLEWRPRLEAMLTVISHSSHQSAQPAGPSYGKSATQNTSYHITKKQTHNLDWQNFYCFMDYFYICRDRFFKYCQWISSLCISFQFWALTCRNIHITFYTIPPNLRGCSFMFTVPTTSLLLPVSRSSIPSTCCV